MDYQTIRPITKKRQSSEQEQANGNNFENYNYDFFTNVKFSNPIAKPFYPTWNQSQEDKNTQ